MINHSSTATKINALLDWCKFHHLKIDPRIYLKPDETGIAAYSRNETIHPSITLVKIPKSAVLSVKSCSAAHILNAAPYGLEAQLTLSLALYIEIAKGRSSRWFGYIQSFPEQIVDLPLFWNLEDDDDDDQVSPDRITAMSWLKGTEVDRILSAPGLDGDLLTEIQSFYHESVVPTFSQYFAREGRGTETPTLRGFYRSYALVSSRAFMVDAYHGLSMVPIADAFNHTYDHHVHLESEFQVCPECGSFRQCPHDREPEADFHPSSSHKNDIDSTSEDYYEMVSNTFIPPQSEVFNTYGETLSNAQLLAQYGFTLDVNENDKIIWRFDELVDFLASESDGSSVLAKSVIRLWDEISSYLDDPEGSFAESQMVFNPALESAMGRPEMFCINCEGRVSRQLWIFVSALHCALAGVDGHSTNLRVVLNQMVEYQTRLEECMEVGGEDVKMEEDGDDLVRVRTLVQRTASTILSLCRDRRGHIGPSLPPDKSLGDFLDELPPNRPRTRFAMVQALTEISILDSCEAVWEGVREMLMGG